LTTICIKDLNCSEQNATIREKIFFMPAQNLGRKRGGTTRKSGFCCEGRRGENSKKEGIATLPVGGEGSHPSQEKKSRTLPFRERVRRGV